MNDPTVILLIIIIIIIIIHLSYCVKQKGFDVFNALDLMENKVFLEKLKFGIGDGNLQYYLYNWKCPSMDADKVSVAWLGCNKKQCAC